VPGNEDSELDGVGEIRIENGVHGTTRIRRRGYIGWACSYKTPGLRRAPGLTPRCISAGSIHVAHLHSNQRHVAFCVSVLCGKCVQRHTPRSLTHQIASQMIWKLPRYYGVLIYQGLANYRKAKEGG
jgi:hypothetical protein